MNDMERTLLQRRIKNQRKALKTLNRYVTAQSRIILMYQKDIIIIRHNIYRHAAQLTEQFWFSKRIAAYIRKWT